MKKAKTISRYNETFSLLFLSFYFNLFDGIYIVYLPLLLFQIEVEI
jgi:hypothetical protein